MLPRETWRVAVEALWSNKLRAILTTLGVVIGSACIVLVVTVAVTGRRYVIGQIEGVGANLVYANYEVNPQQAVVRSNEITLADMEAVKNALPNVVTVAATSQALLRNVVTGGAEHAVTLFGATAGFQMIRNLLILKGRFLDADRPAIPRQGVPDHGGTGRSCFPKRRPYWKERARRTDQLHDCGRFSGTRRNVRAFRNSTIHRPGSVLR